MSGIITQESPDHGKILGYSVFPLNNGYGIIIANTTIINDTKKKDPNQQAISIYTTLIYPYPKEIVGPFLTYQTADFDLTVLSFDPAAISLSGTKYAYILGVSKISDKQKIYWMKISFLSNG